MGFAACQWVGCRGVTGAKAHHDAFRVFVLSHKMGLGRMNAKQLLLMRNSYIDMFFVCRDIPE